MGVALLLAGSLSMTACTPEESQPEELKPGTEFQGELTTERPRNFKDGSRYQKLRVSLPAGEAAVFELESGFAGDLTLYEDTNGRLVRSTTESAYVHGHQEGPITLAHRSEEGGGHILVVSGSDADSYGPFTINARLLDLDSDQSLTVDGSVTDWLGGEPETRSLAIDEAGLYVFDLESTDFDAYLELSGNGVQHEDDDGGSNRNARLQVYLEPGTYDLTARDYAGADAHGLYTLSASRESMPEGELQNSGPLAIDTTITGLLQGSSAEYTLSVEEAGLFTFDLASSSFDSQLRVEGGGHELVDDDGGEGTNSRIQAPLEPGDYRIVAEAYGGGSGVFTLGNRREALPEGVAFQNSGTLESPATVKGLLETGAHNDYTVVISSAGEYTFDLRSDAFDAHLELEGNGARELDDDGGHGTNSMIRTQLEEGEYRLRVKDAFDYGSGLYDLEVR